MTAPHSTPDDEYFSLDRIHRAGTVVVVVSGEVDSYTSPQLTAAIRGALDEPGEAVVVDLSDVSFFSSTGLTVLANAAGDAETRGRELRVVVGGSRAVLRTVEITGLDRVLDLYESVDLATAD